MMQSMAGNGNSNGGWLMEIRAAWGRRTMCRGRADYYDYLSALLDGLQGRSTLQDIFQTDAWRYGPHSQRGRVMLDWAARYPQSGGDLAATWAHCFPVSELCVVRAAQSLGNAPLTQALAQLADVVRLMGQVRSILVATLWTAACGLVVLGFTLALMPLFTVPRLQAVFQAVPPTQYGPAMRALVGLADALAAGWPWLLVAVGGTLLAAVWSLPSLTGPWRDRLDALPPWSLYRHVFAVRFMALLRLTLHRHDNGSVQLRAALDLQRQGANPWQAAQLDRMLHRIRLGSTGAASLDTGLLDRELFWFFSDMVLARGLETALHLAVGRVRQRLLHDIARQAGAWRWIILLSCALCVIGTGLWHYAAIDDLRRALVMLHGQ